MNDKPFVLIVEEDKSCAELLKYMLTRAGYRVMVSEDGQIAQSRIKTLSQPPHLVLLGLLLPLVDGFQLLRQIRHTSGWANTPVIVLSTKIQEQDIIRAFKLGATDYVTKPFQLGELMARISSHLTHSRNHD
jgi:two-component system phosphate regulon response regulator PhoB